VRKKMALMMDERLISACAEILLSPPCQQIDFKWRGQHITAHGYRTVVFAVMEGRIGTGIGHDLKPGEAAKYNYELNYMLFHPTFDPKDPMHRMFVVHEATHAVQDSALAGSRYGIENVEGAAYFANALFSVYCPPHLQTPTTKLGTAGGVFQVAFKAALAYASHSTGVVSEAAIKAIIDALLDDPRFLDEKRNVPFVDWDGFADPVFP
jgi:hypothetical protein